MNAIETYTAEPVVEAAEKILNTELGPEFDNSTLWILLDDLKRSSRHVTLTVPWSILPSHIGQLDRVFRRLRAMAAAISFDGVGPETRSGIIQFFAAIRKIRETLGDRLPPDSRRFSVSAGDRGGVASVPTAGFHRPEADSGYRPPRSCRAYIAEYPPPDFRIVLAERAARGEFRIRKEDLDA